jgi:hypothetical protein
MSKVIYNIPETQRDVVRYHAGIGSSKEWASALSMPYTTFIRCFPPAKHTFGSGITLKTDEDLEDFRDRVLTMRRLLGIKDRHVELPASPKRKNFALAREVPWSSEHPEIAWQIAQARAPWGGKLLRTIALNTYLVEGHQEDLHHLTYAR